MFPLLPVARDSYTATLISLSSSQRVQHGCSQPHNPSHPLARSCGASPSRARPRVLVVNATFKIKHAMCGAMLIHGNKINPLSLYRPDGMVRMGQGAGDWPGGRGAGHSRAQPGRPHTCLCHLYYDSTAAGSLADFYPSCPL